MIFRDYADGLGRNAIQRKLADMGARSHFGGEWTDAHLRELLRNEKYVGDVLMQKYFRLDHLSKKDIENKGQLDRYFIQGHHAPVIDRERLNASNAAWMRNKRNTPDRAAKGTHSAA